MHTARSSLSARIRICVHLDGQGYAQFRPLRPWRRRKIQGKPAVRLNGKTVGTVVLGIVGALTLGTGMCMSMVFGELLIPGIIVGLLGIVLLLCLIPICKGLK